MKKTTALAALLGALILPVQAQAHHHYRAHISMVQAQRAIVHWVGPGTVLTKCRRFAPSVVGCDYETPSANFGIYFEEEWDGFKPHSGTLYSYVTVRQQHGKLHFEDAWSRPA